MSRTILDSRQVELREQLDNVGTEAFSELTDILREIDNSSNQLRVKPEATISQRVLITPASLSKALGFTSNLSASGKMIKFDGAVIDFQTGEIFEADGTTSYLAGVNDFTPFTLAADEYVYYAISVSAGSVNADNTIGLEIQVVEASASDLVLNDAPKADFASNSSPLAQLYVQEDGTATGILNIDWENIQQINVSGSGGGGSAGAEGVRAYKVDAIPRTATDTLIADLDVNTDFTFLKVRVEVTQVFDGTPTLEVGIPSDHDFLFTNDDIDLTSLGIYEISVSNTLASPEEIRCYIGSGGTTGIVNVTVMGFGE